MTKKEQDKIGENITQGIIIVMLVGFLIATYITNYQ